MQQPSIVLLIPYFGKWPVWFDFFLISCRFNTSIQWIIYTDCPIPENSPDNVKYKKISFKDYNIFVSDKLGINFNPDNPYKLCDLKPMLGFIHEDDINNYDFWGFSDIDLIYGNLRQYYTAERLREYDLYSTHSRRVSGHFCLMRNTKKMREAFKLIKNWEARLSDKNHHALDEGAFSRIFIRHKNFPKPLFNIFSKFNVWRRRSEFVEAFSTPNAGVPWIDGSYKFPTQWLWRSGKLTNNLTGEREYPYFHFYGWKKDEWIKGAKFSKILSDNSCFSIDKYGIETK